MKKILLVGKPNVGKTLLFNQLTGLRQKVANYPGVTIDIKQGQCADFTLVDMPGTYSLNGLTEDELVAIEQLRFAVKDSNTAAIVCVLDATRLQPSLRIALDVLQLAKQHAKPVTFALNFIDEVHRYGQRVDIQGLSDAVGVPVLALSARSLDGVFELKQHLITLAGASSEQRAADTRTLSADLLSKQFAITNDIILKNQNRIDNFLLSNVFGSLGFLVVMFVLFQSVFTLAAPLMDGVEAGMSWLAAGVSPLLMEGALTDFVNDALFGGVGGFLVFVPQIMVLTLIIGLLEDSGYLARAALICHRPLSAIGLSGRSFIPYLSGHACAIPAIMAARTIESPHKRLVTMLTIPLTSCSARLPVYALLIAVLVPPNATFLGVFNMQGAAFFGLYFFGIVMALLVSLVLSRSLPKDLEASDIPFILELPSYRMPHWRPLVQKVLQSGILFVKRAAPIIFMVSVLLWFLGYFPSGSDLSASYLGQFGQFIEPLFAPLGLDWRYGVAILMSFLAREVFVGALGTLFGMDNADENVAGLADRIQSEGLALDAGLGLVLFYVVALQCVATVAMLKGETGSHKLAWGVYVAYGLLAYAIAAAVNIIL